MVQDFVLKKWSVWPPIHVNKDENMVLQSKLLASVPKMLKRRLTPLARIVFCAANQCNSENETLPIVFCSTHGELAKSFKMMQQIEASEEISPTAFSLSVHNAIAGLFSIAYQNKVQNTVIAPGEEGIAAAFIEALGLLQEGEEQVLIVLYDEPLVDFYPAAPFQLTTPESRAIALIIAKTGMGTPMRFSCLQTEGDDGEQPLQIPILINFLDKGDEMLNLRTARHTWRWEKNEEI